jgi:isocitrate dehydrogenase
MRALRKDERVVVMINASMKVPVAEMDGDEMARVMWAMVKQKLLLRALLRTAYLALLWMEWT